MTGRPVAALLAALLLAATCEPAGDPRASPTSPAAIGTRGAGGGWEVALVLAPPDGAAGVDNRPARRAAGAVEEDGALDVADVRVLDPPTEAFRRDQMAFAAEGGADLVCTLGDDGADDVAALAPRYPATRFCLLGGTLSHPGSNVVALGWDLRAGGFLAGAAAALARPDADVGLVVASPSPRFEDVRVGFTAGARTVRPDVQAPVATVATGAAAGPQAEEVAGAAAGLYDGEPPVRAVMPYGGPDLAAAVAAVFTPDGAVIGWGADLAALLEDAGEQDAAGQVVVSVVKRFDVALAGVVAHLQDGEDLPTLDVTAFALVAGSDAYRPVRPRLEELVAAVAAGEISTDQPPLPPPSPSPGPS